MNSKNKKLKIAIAGLGFGKKVHLEALKESDYLTPVAIYHYEKKFKDTSINGIPQFNSKWRTSNNDELIDVVIENSCSEFLNG